jgi:N-acetylmuramoyl-L-alanine amidase
MKICVSSGHGKYIRGASGYLDEVDEARRVVEAVADHLRAAGVGVESFHDNTSHDQNTNLHTIVNWHNGRTRTLDLSIHFNAYQTTSKPMGCEVLYYSEQSLASKTSAAIAAAGSLINRGGKRRTDLFFLNNTEEPALLAEVVFVDSQADTNLYRAHFDAICRAIAEATSGVSIPSPEPPDPGPDPGPEPLPPAGQVSIAITAPPGVVVNVTQATAGGAA